MSIENNDREKLVNRPKKGLLRIDTTRTFQQKIQMQNEIRLLASLADSDSGLKTIAQKYKSRPKKCVQEDRNANERPSGVTKFLKRKYPFKKNDERISISNSKMNCTQSPDLLEVQLDYDSDNERIDEDVQTSLNRNGDSQRISQTNRELRKEVDELKNKFAALLQINSKQALSIDFLQTQINDLQKRTVELEEKSKEVDEAFEKLDGLFDDKRIIENDDRSMKYPENVPLNHPTDFSLVKLSHNGNLYVNRERMVAALRTTSYKAFASKIFTALFSVEEVYRCTISGRGNNEEEKKENGRRKRKLNPDFLDEIYKAIEFHYADKVKDVDYKKEVDDVIRHKLLYLDCFFKHLSEGGNFDEGVKKHHIIQLDIRNFRGLEEFEKDRSLFTRLDRELFGDEPDSL